MVLQYYQLCNDVHIYSSVINATTAGCIDCSSANLDMQLFNTMSTSVILAWNSMPGSSYQFHYRPLGEQQYSTYTTSASYVILFGLDDCQTYEFAISMSCHDGVRSEISTPITYTTTACKGAGGDITISDGLAVKVYPNPASEYIQIELAGGLEVDVVNIYNTAGQMVIDNSNIIFDGSVYKTNVDHLQQGLYFVVMAKDDYLETKQFLVR